MTPPIDYGDNFPVPQGSWDPQVPWRFPKHSLKLSQPPLLQVVLPWAMFGIGVALGILLMSARVGSASACVNTSARGSAKPAESGQVLLPHPERMPSQPAVETNSNKYPRRQRTQTV